MNSNDISEICATIGVCCALAALTIIILIMSRCQIESEKVKAGVPVNAEKGL